MGRRAGHRSPNRPAGTRARQPARPAERALRRAGDTRRSRLRRRRAGHDDDSRSREPEAVTGRLRAYVVDDEPGALKQVVQSLKSTGRVDVVGTATCAETALVEVPTRDVEALFLDIHMPGMSGFELLERMRTSALVVFVTAHDEHALRAFEAAAIDYLLKPVKRERLERTLDRLESRRGDPGASVQAVLEKLARHYPRAPAYAERISLDLGQQRTQLVEVAKISHFLAQGKGTVAVTASGSHLVDRALGELEERLDPRQFVRIHRSAIVNLAWVAEVQPELGGRLTVKLKDGPRTELQVARDRARAFRERMVL
ncbi:MAG: DNA-binding response regulator [Candidatus Rokuibacteriota bacterium]|nr:MAG: DNA-binding response regulator [Candidatus Rokubacteria bacterium]